MKLEVNYIEEFEKQAEELAQYEMETSDEHSKESEESYKKFQKRIKLADMIESQYVRKEVPERREALLKYIYPEFSQMAKVEGGHLILEVNDESLTGTLTYYGHDLIINNVFCHNLLCLRMLLEMTDDLTIQAKENMLEMKFMFHLYEKEKVADHSDEIRKLEEQIYSPKYLKLHSNNKA